MTLLFMRPEVARELIAARRSVVPTAEQLEQIRQPASASDSPRSLVIAGDVAEVRVHGTLSKHRDFWAEYWGGGGSTYSDMTAALAAASADPRIKRVVLDINSPGGYVDGLFDFLEALAAFDKPLTARASMACSAAYAIACMAESIEATNPAAEFGSVGVAASFWVFDDIVDITSTEAPDKRPDLRTEEGQAVIRKHLDDIHELFVDAIANGRGTTPKNVNATYGRGGVVLAAEAQRLGMIDSIAKPGLRGRGRAHGSAQDIVNVLVERLAVKDEAELVERLAALLAKPEGNAPAPADLGEQVADLMLQQRGIMLAPEPAPSPTSILRREAYANLARSLVTPASDGPVTGDGRDLGDLVVGILEAQRSGTPAPAYELITPPGGESVADLGEQVADLMLARRSA